MAKRNSSHYTDSLEAEFEQAMGFFLNYIAAIMYKFPKF